MLGPGGLGAGYGILEESVSHTFGGVKTEREQKLKDELVREITDVVVKFTGASEDQVAELADHLRDDGRFHELFEARKMRLAPPRPNNSTTGAGRCALI